MIEMYKGIANSPETELSEGISAQATIIKVNNINAFPEGPNLATIGTDENAETIKYATKTANALSGCQRGIEGTARTWQTGEKIARNFTQKDHADLIANVNEVNENKLGKTEKAADSDKLDGQDCTYFATATAVQTAQETANQGVNAATAAQTAATQGVNAAAAAHSRANEAYTRAEQAFQSASSGKTTIANAITGKGVPTSTTASWSEMARNIGKIKTFKFKRTNINSITLDFNYTHSATLQYTFEKDSILVYQHMKGAYYASDRIEISIYPAVNPWYSFSLDEGGDNRTICVVPAGTYTIRGYSGSTRWSSVSIPFEIFE